MENQSEWGEDKGVRSIKDEFDTLVRDMRFYADVNLADDRWDGVNTALTTEAWVLYGFADRLEILAKRFLVECEERVKMAQRLGFANGIQCQQKGEA